MNKKSTFVATGGGIAAAVIIAAFLISGVSNEPQSADSLAGDADENNALQESGKIRVLASFYPYYEFTRNVAGDSATVEQHLPLGTGAHDWEPGFTEIRSLKNADVYVYNGLGMESFLDNIIGSGEFDNVLFVKASEGVELIKPEEGHGTEEEEHGEHGTEEEEHGEHGTEEEEHGEHGTEEEEHGEHGHHDDFEFDPHIWLDPVLVKQQVNNIRDGLVKADPQNREQYEQNAKAYNEKLDALDMKIKSSLTSCKKDTFVPFHNAFTYLGERYGLKVMALGGLAPEGEASATEIAEFVDYIKDNDIKVIFAEELVDPRLAEVIADEAGARVLLFSPLEGLTLEEVEQNITYIDKMEKNLDAMKVALECR